MSQRKTQLLRLAAVLIVLWLVVRYVLAWIAPFLLALALAAALEPAVGWCLCHLHWKRGFAAAVLTFALSAALLALMAALAALLARQLRRLPELLTCLRQIPPTLDALVRPWLARCPPELRSWLSRLPRYFPALWDDLIGQLWGVLHCLAQTLPRLLLFTCTAVLATAYTSACWPQLCALARSRTTPGLQRKLRWILRTGRTALGQWFRAQLVLTGTTFALLSAGFLLLHQPFALPLAAALALLDALPVLGIGLGLLPWAAVCFLTGNSTRGAALLALWGLLSLVRSLLEPRVMAVQAGLPPLAALAAMYIGFAALGVAGMVLLPLGLLLGKALWKAEKKRRGE